MFRQEQKLSLKYLPSLRMQQGLHMLQFPITELSSYVLQQIIHNPCFDLCSLEEEDWSPCLSLPSTEVSRPESLLSHLCTQIQHAFDDPKDIYIAQHIIGNLSEQGLLLLPLQELALQLEVTIEEISRIQTKIQYFHPLGIASSSLQDYWLFLLKDSHHTLAYTLIKEHYSALRNCDFFHLAKKFRCFPNYLLESLKNALASIPWAPASGYTSSVASQPALPDVYLKYVEGNWEIRISSRGLPPIKIDSSILHIYEQLPKQEKKNLKHQILSAKWLIKNLKKREQLLCAIVEKMLPYQENFLLGRTSAPQAFSVKALANELPYHQSTLFRAIENKTIATPQGIFPLKYLFPQSAVNNTSQSKEMILQWIHQWIASETSPLSDADISQRIAEHGIPCARRTVAKYRAQLNILPAHKRNKHVKRIYN